METVNGFWIAIHKDISATEIVGYLYCCSVCNNVVKDPTDANCKRCGSPIDYDSKETVR